jgi:ferredoxin
MSTSDQKQTWHGVPREVLEWYPTVVRERCNGCGLCVTTCGRKVYRFDYRDRTAVLSEPFKYVVGCSTCATLCPREAIEFPSRGYIQHVIRSARIAHQSKRILDAHPEDYRADQLEGNG